MSIRHENIIQNQSINKTSIRHSGMDHWHQMAEFVYVLEGECRIRIEKQDRTCTPGDLVVIRSGEIHALSNDPGCVLFISTFAPTLLL